MDDAERPKVFVTKLSLPKFVSMIERLTPSQRNLVSSMGFENLLHLRCDFLPHGLILYLVSKFKSNTRSLKMPDGSSYTLTPLSVNKVLGTPLGGKHIGEKVDPELRISIANLTKCKGHYPTINELDKLITPELEGDIFKIVFGMYAFTAFLCPSSHDAVSPFYLHIFKDPNEISSFDHSSAILDKLVSSIDAYNQGITSVLGGNLLLLMVIYFEFLDSDIIPTPSKSLLPRLSVWSTSLVHEIEMIDCVCKNSFQYGRLPIKDVSRTPFGFTCKQGDARVVKSFDQILAFVLSICPENHHAVVKHQLPLIMENMIDEIMDSIEPVVTKNIMNILGIIPFMQSSHRSSNPSSVESQIVQFKSAVTVGNGEDGSNACLKSMLSSSVANILPASLTSKPTSTLLGDIPYVSSSVLATDDKDKDVVMGSKDDGSNGHVKSAGVINTAGSITSKTTASLHPIDGGKAADNPYDSTSFPCTDDKDEDIADLFFLLPVPSVEVLEKLDKEACKNSAVPDIRELVAEMDYIHISSEFDLPNYPELLESMYPQKSEYEAADDCAPSTLDIVAYVLQEDLAESKHKRLIEDKVYLDFGKVNLLEYLDAATSFTNVLATSSGMPMFNRNKRTSSMTKGDISEQCVALKKRSRMFQINEDPLTDSENVLTIEKNPLLGSHEEGEPLSGIHHGGNSLTPATTQLIRSHGQGEASSGPNEHDTMKTPVRFPNLDSPHGDVDQCIALKKKAKLVHANEYLLAKSENPLPIATIPLLGLNDQGEQSSGCHHESNGLAHETNQLFCSHEQGEASSGQNVDNNMKTPDRFANIDSTLADEQFDRELLLSTLRVESEHQAQRSNSQFLNQGISTMPFSARSPFNVLRSNSQFLNQDNSSIPYLERSNSNVLRSNNQFMMNENSNIHISEINHNNVITTFTSTLAEKDVFDDIIARIPKSKKAKTKNVVRMGTTWAEHRVFALSMMVYGNINPYVMNMLGKAVMVEDAEKENLGLLPLGHWKRFYFNFNVAALFMKSCENPGTLSKYLGHTMIGIKLDTRDLVHLPLFTYGFYFLLVVNFREKVFEVLYPNNKEDLLSNHATVAINNFKFAFKIAYKHSLFDVDSMQTVFRRVCSSEKDSDSGVYVMELIRHQSNGKILCFEPNHAKPLRESLTYYMLAHPFNELTPPETKNILKKHNIPYDYKSTPGYYPWMHEQGESSSEASRDSIEGLVLF